MFLLNLSFFEFLALFSAVSGVVVTLYLLSRSRRKQLVPTLRFWVQARQPVPAMRRRRIQQPWSLVLQLLSLLLLLLALAQLKIGSRENARRDHVIVLDASSWMGARAARGTLLDEAKLKARAFVRSIPSSDRVMVVRADALASPVTGMETDRAVIERAIDETRPGASALNLEQALTFAEQIRKLHGSTNGEIVYAGARRVAPSTVNMPKASNLRILDVSTTTDNVGLAKTGARRSDADPELWDLFISVRNYGAAPRRVPVVLQFGGAPAGSASIDIAPGATENRTFHLRTKAAGWVETRLLTKDALPDDNRSILELPALKALQVAVFTDDAEAIRPALAAHPQIQATYYTAAQYSPDVPGQVVVLDRFAPPSAPSRPTIWIEPPSGSAFATRTRVAEARNVRWRADQEVCSGIRSRGLRVENAQTFSPAKGDVVIGEVDGGPVALLRPAQRSAALGFHPGRSDMRFDLATPLLLANLLRWIEPDVFRTAEIHGGSVGTVTAPLESTADLKQVRVLADSTELPYTVKSGTIRFFAGTPGVVRVLDGTHEQVHSLSLPEVGDRVWEPPSSAHVGLPGSFAQAFARDTWQILAVLGTLGLLIEWYIYGRKRSSSTAQAMSAASAAAGSWRKAS